MRRILFSAFALVVLIGSQSACDSTKRLRFTTAGFTIAPLEASPGNPPQKALIMFLPEINGFAGNVNVQIQPYNGSIEDYAGLSLQQFKSVGYNVLQQKSPVKSEVVFEYTGDVQGRPLHFYSRAVKSGGSIYLVTATGRLRNGARKLPSWCPA
jgi:Tfp pilus assembly protein PilX